MSLTFRAPPGHKPTADLRVSIVCPTHPGDGTMVTWCHKFATGQTWFEDVDGFRSEYVGPADLPAEVLDFSRDMGIALPVSDTRTAARQTERGRPADGYFRWVFTCPRPSCNYRAERVKDPVAEALRDHARTLARVGRFHDRITLPDLTA